MNENIITTMKIQLVLKGYSESTIKTYLVEMSSFLALIKTHNADDFDADRIKAYLFYCHTVLMLTEATIHSRINALKFYYEQVLKREKIFFDILGLKNTYNCLRLLVKKK